VLLNLACEKIADPLAFFQGMILEIQAPDTLSSGDFAEVNVIFEGAASTCCIPHHLDVQTSDTTCLIRAFFCNTNRLTPCPDEYPPLLLTFQFEASRPGQYLFLADDGSDISTPLVVIKKE
jgi:hypothetical protein